MLEDRDGMMEILYCMLLFFLIKWKREKETAYNVDIPLK